MNRTFTPPGSNNCYCGPGDRPWTTPGAIDNQMQRYSPPSTHHTYEGLTPFGEARQNNYSPNADYDPQSQNSASNSNPPSYQNQPMDPSNRTWSAFDRLGNNTFQGYPNPPNSPQGLLNQTTGNANPRFGPPMTNPYELPNYPAGRNADFLNNFWLRPETPRPQISPLNATTQNTYDAPQASGRFAPNQSVGGVPRYGAPMRHPMVIHTYPPEHARRLNNLSFGPDPNGTSKMSPARKNPTANQVGILPDTVMNGLRDLINKQLHAVKEALISEGISNAIEPYMQRASEQYTSHSIVQSSTKLIAEFVTPILDEVFKPKIAECLLDLYGLGLPKAIFDLQNRNLVCSRPCICGIPLPPVEVDPNDPCEALRRQWKENRCDQKGFGTHQGVQANMTIISRDTSCASGMSSGMSRTLNRNFDDEEDYADSPGRTPYAGRRADADSPGRTPWAGRRTRSAGPGPGGRSPRSKSPKGRFPEECIDTCPCMRQ